MTVKDLEDLYGYGYWADRKLFDVILQLTPEEFKEILNAVGRADARRRHSWRSSPGTGRDAT